MSEQQAAAVFVDPSGRRGRLAGRFIWLLSCLASAYVILVLLSLVVPAGISRLTLPGLGSVVPGAGVPKLEDADGKKQSPSRLLTPTTRPTRSPAVSRAGSGTSQPSRPSPVSTGSQASVATLSPRATTSAPTRRPVPGSPSPRPRSSPSAVPASPTSPTPRAIPRSTNAPSPKPHPTRTPRR